MATVIPESEETSPLGTLPATVSTKAASTAPSQNAKLNRPKRKHRPKLTVADVTTEAAVNSALAIGRRIAARGPPEPGQEGPALTSFLDKMKRWAGEVAPDHDLAEFVVAAQALAGNRELKPIIGNLRLAELREVTGGWEELQMRKRTARKGRKKVTEEEEEEEEEWEGRNEDVATVSTEKDVATVSTEKDADMAGSNKTDVACLMNDPDVKKRIERNRQLAMQRRLQASGRAPQVNSGGPDEMEIDLNDVVDQEDIDMDVLDEMNDLNNERNSARNQDISSGKTSELMPAVSDTVNNVQPQNETISAVGNRLEQHKVSETQDYAKDGETAAMSKDSAEHDGKARDKLPPQDSSVNGCSMVGSDGKASGMRASGGTQASLAHDARLTEGKCAVSSTTTGSGKADDNSGELAGGEESETKEVWSPLDGTKHTEKIEKGDSESRERESGLIGRTAEIGSDAQSNALARKGISENGSENVDVDILDEFEATKDEEY